MEKRHYEKPSLEEKARCPYIWGIHPETQPCGLEDGHDGPHLFFCTGSSCQGHTMPNTTLWACYAKEEK